MSFIRGSSPSASRKWSHVDLALSFRLFITRCDEEASASEGAGRLSRACEKLSEGWMEEGPEAASDWKDEDLLEPMVALERSQRTCTLCHC